MGLDQYAYVAAKANDYGNTREISYWRKHPNLQGWMEQLWVAKGKPGGSSGQEKEWGSDFNGVELELTWDDIELLEQDVLSETLPATIGFFFGDSADKRYKEHDLNFIRQAKAEIFSGLKVFYNSSW